MPHCERLARAKAHVLAERHPDAEVIARLSGRMHTVREKNRVAMQTGDGYARRLESSAFFATTGRAAVS